MIGFSADDRATLLSEGLSADDIQALSALGLPLTHLMAIRQAARDDLALAHLADFVRWAWPIVEPGRDLCWNWHIEVICEALERVSAGELRELVICVPPGTMKSLIVAVFWPAWRWLHAPEERILCITNDEKLAGRDARRMRDILRSPDYQRLIRLQDERGHTPAWTLARDQNVKVNYANTRQGFRQCLGVDGTITGKRGDGQIIDDPYDAKEVLKGDPEAIAARMQEVVELYDQVWKSRLNDQRTGWRVVIMQRLHEHDLAGVLIARMMRDQAQDKDFIVLPMEFDPALADPRDPRTKAGALLDPVRFPQPAVDELREALGPSQAAAQLDQNPAPPTGGILQEAWWRWIEPGDVPARFERIIQSWDLAFGASNTSAYCVGYVLGLLKGRVYVLDMLRERAEFPRQLQMVQELSKRHPKARKKLLEAAANAKAVESTLREQIPGLVLVPAISDKVTRAQMWSPYLQAGNIVLIRGMPWARHTVGECAALPRGRFKDCPDALGLGVLELLEGGNDYQNVVPIEVPGGGGWGV